MEAYKCKCGVLLETCDDISELLIEVPIVEEKKEEHQLKENEWICDHCQQINAIDVDDIFTSQCRSKIHGLNSLECKRLNDIVREMVVMQKSSMYKN